MGGVYGRVDEFRAEANRRCTELLADLKGGYRTIASQVANRGEVEVEAVLERWVIGVANRFAGVEASIHG
jgi:hypothetical protein